MPDKILGVACFGLSAMSQAYIQHSDTANWYSLVFFILGTYEFVVGEYRHRRQLHGDSRELPRLEGQRLQPDS